MANLLDIRRRIKSVKNTQQITKAMKMVSAAKLKRAQDRVATRAPFANKMTEVLVRWPRKYGRFSSSSARRARGRTLSGRLDHCGQGIVRRLQYQPDQRGQAFLKENTGKKN